MLSTKPKAMNEKGMVVGNQTVGGFDRGFRSRYNGEDFHLLPPLYEPNSWVTDINDRGDALGYSFNFDGLERIGIWDADRVFHEYFVEGTPEYPTMSNKLLFNNSNLIVITATTDAMTYIVPRPGVRLPLDSISTGVPAGFWYGNVLDMNNRGDLLTYAGVFVRVQ